METMGRRIGGHGMSEGPDLTMIRHLKAKGRYQEARDQLASWLEAEGDNPRLVLEMAFTLDNLGQEVEAITYYEKAFALGLDKGQRSDAYIGLGSSLKVVGRTWQSRKVLEEGLAEFPNHPSMRIFYALTLFQDGNPADALRQVLDVTIREVTHTEFTPYRKTLQYYRDHLTESWPVPPQD